MRSNHRFAEFGALLRHAGLEPDAESIADALWLAQWLPGVSRADQKINGGSQRKHSGTSSRHAEFQKDSKQQSTEHTAPTPKPRESNNNGQLFTGGAGAGGKKASAIQVPAASALPGALELARALRPFNRRRPSAHRQELDEEATAESIAQFRFLRVVTRPVAEAWFDVALVVDSALSMDPWRKTLDEFEQLLVTHGAFGQVHRWRLVCDGDIALEAGGTRATPNALVDSRGRTLILVATNGVAEYWNADGMAKTIELWTRSGPVAIVQLFGERQWPHTALGPASRLVRAPLPGVANTNLHVERKHWERRQPDGRVVAIPIVTLSSDSIVRWANAAMSVGLGGAPAVVFGHRAVSASELVAGCNVVTDARTLVQTFRTFASPEAFRLACYLAATTMTLPVMRIVQQEVARAPRVEHLAEVIASGLVERVTPADADVDADNVVYDFRPGVRDILVGALQMGTAFEVRTRVEVALKGFIERQLGKSIENFQAFVLDESGLYEIPESAKALIEIERSLLRRFRIGVARFVQAEGLLAPLTGIAKTSRRVLVIDGTEPAEQAVARAVTDGLRRVGHDVVSVRHSALDAVILVSTNSTDVRLAKEIVADEAVEAISLNVKGRSEGGLDFRNRAQWHASFEQLLQKLDDTIVPGSLVGVPTVPGDYWHRKEHDIVLQSRFVQLNGPEGSGRHTLAAAVARDRITRRRFRGGVYWRPSVYPRTTSPVLLINPQFVWLDRLSPEDGIIVTRPPSPPVPGMVTVFLRDLSVAEQREFLGSGSIPAALPLPVLGRMKLLARWKRIMRHFGTTEVIHWLSDRTVPTKYGRAALLFAAQCAVDLLSHGDRMVLDCACRDRAHSIDEIQRDTALPASFIENALQAATSLDMFAGSKKRTLRAEFREVLQPRRAKRSHAEPVRFLFFACYAHTDRAISRFLRMVNEETSRILGYKTQCFDFMNIDLGEAWSDGIMRGLAQSEVLLVMLSPASVKSEWVHREIRFFLEHQKAIVPVLFKACNIPPEIDAILRYDASQAGLDEPKYNDRTSQTVRSVARAIASQSRAAASGRSPLSPAELAYRTKQKGYRALLAELYERRGNQPEIEKFYWRLLATARSGDEEWQDWFVEILDQTTKRGMRKGRRPTDPVWHEAMWGAAAWLNDPDQFDSGVIQDLLARHEHLYDLLIANHTDTVTSRVASYFAFNGSPSVDNARQILAGIDERAEELRFGRALLPWLQAVSWIVARVDDAELLDVLEKKILTVEANWDARMTSKGEFAELCQSRIRKHIRPWLTLAKLANQIQIVLQQGDAEEPAIALEYISQIQDVQINLDSGEVQRLLEDQNVGRRLIVYSRTSLYTNPNCFESVLKALEREEETLGQYWGLKAIESNLGGISLQAHWGRLLALEPRFPSDSHRYALLQRILKTGEGSSVDKEHVGDAKGVRRRSINPEDEPYRPAAGHNNLWYQYRHTDRVIVFVHGVLSDSRGCWYRPPSENRPGVYWPDLLLKDRRFIDYSIYLGGYYTDVKATQYEVGDCAEELYSALKRRTFEEQAQCVMDHKTIVFLCHSTGGIVVRYLLTDRPWAFEDKRVGLVLIASPSARSPLANRLDLLLKYFRYEYGTQLGWGDWQLEELDQRFRILLREKRFPKLLGAEACEERFSLDRKWLPSAESVAQGSTGAYFDRVEVLLGTDHFTCVKPRDEHDSPYRFLLDFCAAVSSGQTNTLKLNTLSADFPRDPGGISDRASVQSCQSLHWHFEIDEEGDGYSEMTYKGIVLPPRRPFLFELPPPVQSGHTTQYELVQDGRTTEGASIKRGPTTTQINVEFPERPTESNPAQITVRCWDLNVYSMNMEEYRQTPGWNENGLNYAEKYVPEQLQNLTLHIHFPQQIVFAREPFFEICGSSKSADRVKNDELTTTYQRCFHYSAALRQAVLSVELPPAPFSYRISWLLGESRQGAMSPLVPLQRQRQRTFARRLLLMRRTLEDQQEEQASDDAKQLAAGINSVLASVAEYARMRLGGAQLNRASLDISLMVLDEDEPERPWTDIRHLPVLRIVAGTLFADPQYRALGLFVGDGNAGRAWKRRRGQVFDLDEKNPKRHVYVPISDSLRHRFLISVPLFDPVSEALIYGILNFGTFSDDQAALLRRLGGAEEIERFTSYVQSYVLKRLMELLRLS